MSKAVGRSPRAAAPIAAPMAGPITAATGARSSGGSSGSISGGSLRIELADQVGVVERQLQRDHAAGGVREHPRPPNPQAAQQVSAFGGVVGHRQSARPVQGRSTRCG